MPIICQRFLPVMPWMHPKTRKLPGIQPVGAGEWLLVDDAFAQQMAYRDALLRDKREQVFMAQAQSLSAQRELLSLLLGELNLDYTVNLSGVIRPDGQAVDFTDEPIITAAKLVQEDLLILQDGILTAAVLCFPASWTLAEKFGRGMIGIHDVVSEYDDDMSKRVGRLFDAIRPEQPLWRANYMVYEDAELHQPRLASAKRISKSGEFVRVERQTLRKLPETGAVVFGIHTYVVPLTTLTKDEHTELLKYTAEA